MYFSYIIGIQRNNRSINVLGSSLFHLEYFPSFKIIVRSHQNSVKL